MNSGAVVAAGVLAKTGEAAKSGPIGLAVILILCIVSYFLFKSMSKHLRKVREEYPAEDEAQEPGAAAPPDEPAGAAAPQPSDESMERPT